MVALLKTNWVIAFAMTLMILAPPLVSPLVIGGDADVSRGRNLQLSPLNSNNADLSRTGNLQSLEAEPNNADLSRTMNLQTFELDPPPNYRLSVNVVNSSNLPVENANVTVANFVGSTDSNGSIFFDIPSGTYDVLATHSNYNSASWRVDLGNDKNITLILSSPYNFVGEISDADIIVTPIDSGYNISLLDVFSSSTCDVFFDWNYVGNLQNTTSFQDFTYNQLPNLVVEAASKGSPDYPNARFKHLVPLGLTPWTGNEGAFLNESVPYMAGSIFVIPYPPFYGENTTIGVTLHNPYDYILHLSRIDFQVAVLTFGSGFKSVGYLSDITLQVNETSNFSIVWLADLVGHHCVRVVLTYSPAAQVLQRNLDIEKDIIIGGEGEIPFELSNPSETTQTITIKIKKSLPDGWQATLEINGKVYDTSSDIPIDLPPGASIKVVLKIVTSEMSPGNGVVDVEAYIDDQLIGGVRKTLETIPRIPHISLSCLFDTPMGFETNTVYVTGTGWVPGSVVKLTQGEDVLNILLGYVIADKQGKFSIPCGVQSMGVMPIPTKISANAQDGQSAWEFFIYLGNRDALLSAGECLIAIFPIAVSIKIITDVGEITAELPVSTILYKFFTDPAHFPYDSVALAIASAVLKGWTKLPIIGGVKCLGTIIDLVSGKYHDLDLLVVTENGTLGTTGEGVYVNTFNNTWASGNNFNDTQMILMPLTKSFNVTIDASRALYDVEPYNMSFAFACGIVNKTANLSVQGEILKGTRVSYQVDLVNWTISVISLGGASDVASANLVPAKMIIGKGYTGNVTVTAQNQGEFVEDFNVTINANATQIATLNFVLSNGTSQARTFAWNTTGFAHGNYTLSATADVILGETDTADNDYTSSIPVHVGVPGDVSSSLLGVYDQVCNMKDVAYLVKLFNTKPDSPEWNANADVDNNGVVSMIDIAIAILNFNQHE